MNIKQRRILRGNNDLMDQAYRELARAANRMDWIVVWVCVIAFVLVGVFA